MALSYPQEPILIIDDEEPILQAMESILSWAGINNIAKCSDSREVPSLLKKQSYAAITLDLSMPHVSGQDLLSEIVRDFAELPIIVVTATANLDTAVECMKLGAFDYLLKPVDKTRLVTCVRHCIESGEMRRENTLLKEHLLSSELVSPGTFSQIITEDAGMMSIFKYIEAVAQTALPVLIVGETGTGKELMAHALHVASGRYGNFIAVNVAGLDDTLFSDTLFGHKKGAFTDATDHRAGMIDRASEGTLFLDEIGDLAPASQVKLLRLLQEREYYPLGTDRPSTTDARFVFATNIDLDDAMNNGTFRPDLYYRLRSHQIRIPPLRDRIGDVVLLAKHFLAKAVHEIGKAAPSVSRGFFEELILHDFPGNIRELEGMMYDAVVNQAEGKLRPSVIGATGVNTGIGAELQKDGLIDAAEFFTSLASLPGEDRIIQILTEEALKRSNGNRTSAAVVLGIDRSTLSKRIKKYQLQ
jgi:DNA-binding NtrC family response regulator